LGGSCPPHRNAGRTRSGQGARADWPAVGRSCGGHSVGQIRQFTLAAGTGPIMGLVDTMRGMWQLVKFLVAILLVPVVSAAATGTSKQERPNRTSPDQPTRERIHEERVAAHREQREKLLEATIRHQGHAWCDEGIQVGALARAYLAVEYVERGRYEETERIAVEIDSRYPGAINPAGAPIDDMIIMPIGSDKRGIKQKDYRLTDPAQGVLFDLNGDGRLELVAWTAPGSKLAFLALDRNGNGTIDSGAELFGNHTLPGAGNGFAALSQSTPCKGLVREGCALYEQLLLWEDDNHDGISAAEELHKFSDHYLGISGGYVDDGLRDKYGNEFRLRGTAAVRDPGKSKHYPDEDPGADLGLLIPIWDVFLRGR
jgi:hypothetical protein